MGLFARLFRRKAKPAAQPATSPHQADLGPGTVSGHTVSVGSWARTASISQGTGYAQAAQPVARVRAGTSATPRPSSSDDTLNPLNPMSPISPMNPARFIYDSPPCPAAAPEWSCSRSDDSWSSSSDSGSSDSSSSCGD